MSDSDVKYEDVDRYRVSPDFTKMLQNYGKHFEFSENEYKRFKEKLAVKTGRGGNSVGGTIVAVVIALTVLLFPVTLMVMRGNTVSAIIWVVVIAAVIAFYFFADKNYKKLAADRLNALESGKYAAYKFSVTNKRHSSRYANKKQRVESYYVYCGETVFSVYEDEYDEVDGTIVAALFFLDGRTLLEFFAPDRGGSDEE
ncbi:MAG: hypothetical protein LBI36_00940 [Oscillospiraceae bacterium]|jgi:hypothetical protein|nr:hypothetical protein [Oscillospiraceae bacterium]